MAESQVTHPVSSVDQDADDFKQIHGIGPALERRLQEAGFHTYTQLAEANPGQLAHLFKDMTGLSADRIAKQDWIGQARQLIEDTLKARQHYTLFSVELLLDEGNNVRRTRVKNAQTGQESSWAGWEAGRLNRFIESQAMLPASNELEPASDIHLLKVSHKADEPEASLEKSLPLHGDLKLIRLEMVATGHLEPQRSIQAGKPFQTRLMLDLSDMVDLPGLPLHYSAEVYLKRIDSRPYLTIHKANGELLLTQENEAQIQVAVAPMEPGIYQMDALVTVFTASPGLSHESNPGMRRTAMIEGSRLQVYT